MQALIDVFKPERTFRPQKKFGKGTFMVLLRLRTTIYYAFEYLLTRKVFISQVSVAFTSSAQYIHR